MTSDEQLLLEDWIKYLTAKALNSLPKAYPQDVIALIETVQWCNDQTFGEL
jgi:hypothetical protein